MSAHYCYRTGKYRLTELDAQLVVARVEMQDTQHRTNREIRMPRRYYKCEFCHEFHTTSQDKNQEVDETWSR